MKLKLLPILILISFFISCKKDSSVNNNPPAEQLPPETQEGKDTFGCLVNGQVWLPSVPINFSGLYALTASYGSGVFYITATKKTTGIYQGINLRIWQNFHGIGTYPLNFRNDGSGRYSDLYKNCEYETDSINMGQMTITRFDSVAAIVSGTFYFRVAQPGCDTINITEGRFDVKYND